MSLEVIDIFIIIVVLFFCLLFVSRKVKRILGNAENGHCSGCSERTCSIEEKETCESNEEFK